MNAIFLHLKIMALYLCDIRQEHMNQPTNNKQKNRNISPIYRYKKVHASSTFMCLKKKQKVCNVLCVLVIFGLGPLAELLTRRFLHFMDHTVLQNPALPWGRP